MKIVETPAEMLKPINYARAHWIPRRDGGRPVSSSTLYRWIKKGAHGVKLQALFTPSGCVTSEQAIRDFLESVDQARRSVVSSRNVLDASEIQLKATGLQ